MRARGPDDRMPEGLQTGQSSRMLRAFFVAAGGRAVGMLLRHDVGTAGMDIRNIGDVAAFTTKDGSEIRELLAHRNSCIRNQSLAEARLADGRSTAPHYHPKTEEIYYVLEGEGLMQVGEQSGRVGSG